MLCEVTQTITKIAIHVASIYLWHRSKMYELACGGVTQKKRFKQITAHLWLLWTLSPLNATTKHESDKYDRPIFLWMTTSHHKIPVQGEKVTYTSALRERGGKCLLNARRRPFTAAWRMAWGFVLWMAWEERGGALWQALCERRNHILIAAEGGCHHCQWAFVCSSRWNTTGLNSTTKYLSHILFS